MIRREYHQVWRCYLLAALVVGMVAPSPLRASGEATEEDPSGLELYFSKEQLVETANRYPISLVEVAENFLVIGAEQIADSHAHNLYELLRLQAGMFIPFSGRDFGNTSMISSQGSQPHHTLVLIDGIRLNDASGGLSHLELIPLGMVKRLEIIKGPASSTWGSSLGGVINIITKETGDTPIPKGTLQASSGEGDSRELSGELAGKNGLFSYYLHGGRMESDGLVGDRFFARDSVFAKTQLELPKRLTVIAEAGFSNPDFKTLNWNNAWGTPDLDLFQENDTKHLWGLLSLHAPLGEQLRLNLACQRYSMRFIQDYKALGTGMGGSYGTFLYGQEWEDATDSFNGSLTWTGQQVSGIVGVENSRSRMDNITTVGALWGSGQTVNDPGFEERRGVYSNLTVRLGKFSFTPGLRYDYTSQSDSFFGPSLGLVYQSTHDTLFRTTLSQGFTSPYLGLILDNPGLKPENTRSYQVGVESVAIPYLHLKSSIFMHELADLWLRDPALNVWVNGGKGRLRGVEMEFESTRWHEWGLAANATQIWEDNASVEADPLYAATFGIDYKRDGHFKAALTGNYVWWNKSWQGEEPHYNTVIWDARLSKTFSSPRGTIDLFLVGHNLFAASNYWDKDYPNPGRWLEAGLRFRF